MPEPETGAPTSFSTPYEVNLFAKRFHLESSLTKSIELTRSIFGERLMMSKVTVEDGLTDDDEVERVILVEIAFKGTQPQFHEAYRRFVSEWVNSVPDAHQPLIQFRFHIENR